MSSLVQRHVRLVGVTAGVSRAGLQGLLLHGLGECVEDRGTLLGGVAGPLRLDGDAGSEQRCGGVWGGGVKGHALLLALALVLTHPAQVLLLVIGQVQVQVQVIRALVLLVLLVLLG